MVSIPVASRLNRDLRIISVKDILSPTKHPSAQLCIKSNKISVSWHASQKPISLSILMRWCQDRMAAILQMVLSKPFVARKLLFLIPVSHSSVFSRVQSKIIQHWYRYWLGAEKAKSHYLNKWWPTSMTHMCASRPQCVDHSRSVYACQRTCACVCIIVHVCKKSWVYVHVSKLFINFCAHACYTLERWNTYMITGNKRKFD